MAKKKITRKELLKDTDEFFTFSTRVAHFITAHLREIKIVGVALAILAVAYLGLQKYLGYVNQSGQNAYNEAHYVLAEEMKPDANPERLEKSKELFETVRNEHGLSKASRLALPQIAYLEFLNGNYDQAIDLYKMYLEKVSDKPRYEFLANLALASCFEAKGDLKSAIEILRPLSERPDNPFAESAQINLARLYRLDNQSEKAKQILEAFVERYPESPFVGFAKAHL
jgi:outer membrane protein assembly factor BamD (BamD/ComL family)